MKRRTFLKTVAAAGITAGVASRATGSKPTPPNKWEWSVGPWLDVDRGEFAKRNWTGILTGDRLSAIMSSVCWASTGECRTYSSREFLRIPLGCARLRWYTWTKGHEPRKLLVYIEECRREWKWEWYFENEPILAVDFHEVFSGTHTIVEGVF